MAVNGKQKGNKFERDIANKFSARFADYTGIEKSFRRNPDSGSFFGGTNIDRKDVYDTDWAIYGDLICPRNFNFSVECKHYKKAPPLNAILKQKVSDWDDWIAQAKQDAEASEKEMLLIIKYNNTETLAMTMPGVTTLLPMINYQGVEIQVLEHVINLKDSLFFTEDK